MPLDPLWTPPTQDDFSTWAKFLVNPRERHFNDQRSVTSQLMDLMEIARRIGKYDALTWLQRTLTNK